jgi:hypothetical protein
MRCIHRILGGKPQSKRFRRCGHAWDDSIKIDLKRNEIRESVLNPDKDPVWDKKTR